MGNVQNVSKTFSKCGFSVTLSQCTAFLFLIKQTMERFWGGCTGLGWTCQHQVDWICQLCFSNVYLYLNSSRKVTKAVLVLMHHRLLKSAPRYTPLFHTGAVFFMTIEAQHQRIQIGCVFKILLCLWITSDYKEKMLKNHLITGFYNYRSFLQKLGPSNSKPNPKLWVYWPTQKDSKEGLPSILLLILSLIIFQICC